MKTIELSPGMELVIVTTLRHSEAFLRARLEQDPANEKIVEAITVLQRVRQYIEAAPPHVTPVTRPKLRLVKDGDQPDDDLFPGF